jgi:hypothetical protein
VSRQDSVVRLNDGSRGSGSRVDSELELGLLAVLGGETLEEESTETRTGTTTERVEDQETLERLAVICIVELAAVQERMYDIKTYRRHDEFGR